MPTNYSYWSVSSLFMITLLAFSGCAGTTPPQKKVVPQVIASTATPFPAPKSQSYYRQVLQNLKFGGVFSFGEVNETLTNGKVSFLTVPLHPKDTDKNSKEINFINNENLLRQFGINGSQAFGEEVGISPKRVKFVIIENKCRANIIVDNVSTECDRDESIKVGSSKSVLLEPFKDLIKILHGFIDSIEGSVLNKASVGEYCSKTLPKNFMGINIKNDINCKKIINSVKGEYVIKDVKTTGFLTDGFPEKFDIKISNSKNSLESLGLVVDIAIINSAFSSATVNRPSRYLKNIYDKKKLSDAEKYLATWYKSQMN